MVIVDPGHVYDLEWLDGKPKPFEIEGELPEVLRQELLSSCPDAYAAGLRWWPNRLIFVKREGEGYPGNVGHHPGTTIQEVLRALINRVQYLDKQIHHERNDDVVQCLRRAIYELEVRAAARHGRLDELPRLVARFGPKIESMKTCRKCLHIGCVGGCHP